MDDLQAPLLSKHFKILWAWGTKATPTLILVYLNFDHEAE